MKAAESISCVSGTSPPNFFGFVPDLAINWTCEVPAQASAWDFGWTAVAAIATAATAAVAVWVATYTDRKSKRRELESRAIESHERWSERFFRLGSTVRRERTYSDDLIQEVKTASGTYQIHILALHEPLAEPFRSYSSSIRKVHEIANQMFHTSKAKLKTYSEVEALAYNFSRSDGWYRDYRSHVSQCGKSMARFHAGKISAKTAATELAGHEIRFRDSFTDVFALINEREGCHGTLEPHYRSCPSAP